MSHSDEITIRHAVPEDAATLSALIVSLAPYYMADADNPEAAASFFHSVSAESLESLLQDERYRYHVAEVGGVVAGVISVRDDSHLYHLYVAEPYHRRGIASRLWRAAQAAARAAGNSGRFTVNASLYGLPLYRGFGFVATGEVVAKDGVVFQPMELVEG